MTFSNLMCIQKFILLKYAKCVHPSKLWSSQNVCLFWPSTFKGSVSHSTYITYIHCTLNTKLKNLIFIQQKDSKQLQESNDRLELELMYNRNSEINGTGELFGELGEEETAYKQRYEQAMRELEMSRRRQQQQHQDDLQQLIALKKQLGKKVCLIIYCVFIYIDLSLGNCIKIVL